MQSDAMGLLLNTAILLRRTDPARAFALLEMSNNLRLVMRGEASIEDWNRAYTWADRPPVDIDQILPVPG